MATPIIDIPQVLSPLATPTTQGGVPNFPLTPAQAGVDVLATTAVPAFVANAATIAPGTDKSSEYTIESTRTLSAAATLTVSTANSPRQGNKYINCKALALGYAISIVNGGAAGGTIATIDASLTKGMGVALWFDGTNYFFNGYVELG